jgi:prepilin-type processing-associated H-X9-DG protein
MQNSRFSLQELVFAVIVILVLVGIAFLAYKPFRINTHKVAALHAMKQLGNGLSMHIAHANGLPAEDSPGGDTWANAAKAEASDTWYNALPRLLGRKGVGDFASSPRAFYTKENLLYLPGAIYPDSDKRMRQPLFPIAFNSKLRGKDSGDRKVKTKLADITSPARTVIFFERGLPDERRTLQSQTENDYDGSCKGSAKSFVGRYNGKGFLLFLDGHVEEMDARDILTESGDIPFPPTDFIWMRTPEENPNKTSSEQNKLAR